MKDEDEDDLKMDEDDNGGDDIEGEEMRGIMKNRMSQITKEMKAFLIKKMIK